MSVYAVTFLSHSHICTATEVIDNQALIEWPYMCEEKRKVKDCSERLDRANCHRKRER
jgi:hypothetical protein